MNQLEQYIYEQLTKSYTPDQIRSFLVSRGYEQKEVESSIIKANNKFLESQLINYVSSTLKQGYQPQQIHDQLLKQGYQEKSVDLAFNDVNKNQYGGKINVTHQHTVSNNSIIKIGVMLLVVALIVGGGFFSFQHFSGKDDVKLLDISSEATQLTLKPNDLLKFKLTMLNQGNPGRVDIYLTYTVETVEGNRVIQKQETKAFETTIRDVVSMKLPPDIPEGTYIVNVEAKYKDQQALSSFTFYISKNDVVPENPAPVSSQSQTEITTPTKNNSEEKIITSKLRDPPKIKTVLTKGDDDDEIFTKAVAEKDAGTSAAYCQEIKASLLKDECFVYVASLSKDASYCDLVNDQSRKEDCKMDFVLTGNSSLCTEMTLDENKQLCQQFTQMNALYKYGKTGDVDVLMGDLHVQPIPTQTPTNTTVPDSIDELDIGDVVH